MVDKIKVEEEFYNKYLEFYIDRFVYTSIDIEKDKMISVRTIKKKNLLRAFQYALDQDKEMLDSFDIKYIGDLINSDDDNVPEGFRRIQVIAGERADFIPVLPQEILEKLYSLLDSYENIWNDLSVYEREAMFHIGFMRIHPFEDGNKRVAKTILNRNLLYQNEAPVLILEEDTELYYKFINDRDYVGFAEFLRRRSANELTNMVGLYKMLNNVPTHMEITSFLKIRSNNN